MNTFAIPTQVGRSNPSIFGNYPETASPEVSGSRMEIYWRHRFRMEEVKVPVLRFPEYHKNWSKVKLGQKTKKVGSGVTPRGGSNVYTESGTLFIRSQNVNQNRLLLEDVAFIPDEIHSSMSSSKVYPNDVLLNITGASIGRSCLVPSNVKEANVNQHVCIIRLNDSEIPSFYQAFLASHKGQKLIFQGQAGGGREGINFASIRSFSFQVPDKPEQQKIASFLSAVDTKIEQLTRKKELLVQYKKGVMQKLFPPAGGQAQSGEQHPELRFKQEDGSDYPDWEVKSLSSFLIPTLREIPTPKIKYLAIGIRSHCRGTFQKPDSDPNKIAMEKLFIVRENDLVVNITFAWEGAIAMVKKQDDGGLVSHRFPTYTFERSIMLYEYFKYVFVQKHFRFMLDLISPGGAGRNRVLSKKEFLKLKVYVPDTKEQNKISDFLVDIDAKINFASTELEKTQAFKKGLLQQMFV